MEAGEAEAAHEKEKCAAGVCVCWRGMCVLDNVCVCWRGVCRRMCVCNCLLEVCVCIYMSLHAQGSVYLWFKGRRERAGTLLGSHFL